MSDLILALVLVTVVVGASMQRITGLGFALVASPFIVLLLGARSGVILVNAGAVVVAGILTVRSIRDVDWRKYAVLVCAALIGILPGAFLVKTMPASWLEIVVGVLILVGLGSTMLVRSHISPDRKTPLAVSGIASGLMNVMAGVGGPPLGIYGVLTRWDPRSFAATMQPCFFSIGALSLVSKFLFSAAVTPDYGVWIWIALLGAAVVGMVVGEVFSSRVTPRTSRVLLVCLASLGAITVLVRGILEVV